MTDPAAVIRTSLQIFRRSFDFVFSGKAFKNNGWVKMNVTINFGSKMTEGAWIKFGKAAGVKKTANTTKKVKMHKKVSKKSSK